MGAAAIAAASVCAAGGAAAQEYSRDWKRLRSDHFTAVGNGSFAEIRRVLLEVEGFRRAVLEIFDTRRAAPAVPTTIVVFRDDRSFAPFKPTDSRGERRDTIAGYFLSGGATHYMAVAMHSDVTRTFSYLFHEYTHALVRAHLGAPPHWLNEGLAEFFSTVQARPRDRRSVVGLPPVNRLAYLKRERLLPLRELLTFTSVDTLEGSTERSATFYAQSWALVHYLLLADGGRHRAAIAAFASAGPGAPPDAIVPAALGRSVEALERDVARYARQDVFPQTFIADPEGPPLARMTQEVMREADVAALHDELHRLLQESRRAPAAAPMR